ncbi:MAG TPA: GrpB family protein, partial [Spirochaetia bacterium]|nr:GrpB family protein [Spirochaetia bacterium]
ARCKEWLVSILGPETALRVEHYGSTALEGIPAKPIIDILVEIPELDLAMPSIVPRLNDPFWEYWWYKDHLTFIRRDRLGGTRTHHLHMAPRGHAVWQGVAFRDYLRSHPRDAARYADLKRRLAGDFRDDRERYTDRKEAFVREIAATAATGAG